MKLLGRFAGALLLASSLFSAPAMADGLYDNVNGFTLDDDGQLIRFTGILIDRDGKVAKLLDRKDKRPRELDWRKDGDGRTLMPGFIDAHGHIMELGFKQLTLDLSQTNSLADAQAANDRSGGFIQLELKSNMSVLVEFGSSAACASHGQ